MYADKVECKPPRTDFAVSVDAPLKHKLKALLSEAEYAKVPGRDPDGDLHGPPVSTYNIHTHNVAYCLDDCECVCTTAGYSGPRPSFASRATTEAPSSTPSCTRVTLTSQCCSTSTRVRSTAA